LRSRTKNDVDDHLGGIPEGVTGFLLRLGEGGLGCLSQDQTIDRALGLWEGEGQAVIPLGIRQIAADTVQRSRREGLTVLVGYGGRLILQLDRASIEGKGREQPTSDAQMFDNDPNPWSDIDKANYWLLSDSARELNNESYKLIAGLSPKIFAPAYSTLNGMSAMSESS
jgi:hypothetical protein